MIGIIIVPPNLYKLIFKSGKKSLLAQITKKADSGSHITICARAIYILTVMRYCSFS